MSVSLVNWSHDRLARSKTPGSRVNVSASSSSGSAGRQTKLLFGSNRVPTGPERVQTGSNWFHVTAASESLNVRVLE